LRACALATTADAFPCDSVAPNLSPALSQFAKAALEFALSATFSVGDASEIVVLWRAGLRIHEALALNESDLDHRRGALLVRRGKGGRRREVGMDEWAWEHLQPWIDLRLDLPVGPLSASSTARRAAGHGRPPPHAPICAWSDAVGRRATADQRRPTCPMGFTGA
jgi:integrase